MKRREFLHATFGCVTVTALPLAAAERAPQARLGSGLVDCHVYVEKPCSHNLRESHLLVKAAREHKKCVQHGTQRRSSARLKAAVQALRDGVIGKVLAAKAINHQLRQPIGREPVSTPPPGVNYDLWLGPAPKHAFTRNRWHYNWHWYWDYGCGDLGNDGIHQVDMARWGLGVDYPKAVVCSGGQLFYDDDHETPDTQTVIYEYDRCQLIYEMRLWTDYPMEGHDNGTIFYGTEGSMEDGRSGVKVIMKDGSAVGWPAAGVGPGPPMDIAGQPHELHRPRDASVQRCGVARHRARRWQTR